MANFATIEAATDRARHLVRFGNRIGTAQTRFCTNLGQMANQLLEPYLIEYVPAIEGLCAASWSIRRYSVRNNKPKIRINPTKVRNF